MPYTKSWGNIFCVYLALIALINTILKYILSIGVRPHLRHSVRPVHHYQGWLPVRGYWLPVLLGRGEDCQGPDLHLLRRLRLRQVQAQGRQGSCGMPEDSNQEVLRYPQKGTYIFIQVCRFCDLFWYLIVYLELLTRTIVIIYTRVYLYWSENPRINKNSGERLYKKYSKTRYSWY